MAGATNSAISSGVGRAFSSSQTYASANPNSGAGGAIVAGVGILTLASIGSRSVARNTKKREELILEQYEQEKYLPKRVLRQLRVEHFLIGRQGQLQQ
ncbi:hypothetical protein GCM10023189_49490 [Nibrella saemangeumensis]|uniref:Uncharacterized protein n=2 Tax=Nibrella saemangeumensis TaxID=1084526 RepID=A0ABP8NK92_9BACT